MKRTVLVGILITVVASSLVAALFATGIIGLPIGPSTSNTPKTTFKTANATATNQLLINSTKPAIQSVTFQGCNLSTITTSNNKLPSNWFMITVNTSQSCSVIVNLSYTSSYNITFTGLSNGSAYFSGGNGQLTIYANFKVTNIHLSMDSYAFSSATNATLTLRNTGNATATLVSYNATDGSGNTWTLTSWNGPIISPNAVVPTNILIGSSCFSCTYTGTANAFNGFNPGYSYTITVYTSTSQPFKWTILR